MGSSCEHFVVVLVVKEDVNVAYMRLQASGFYVQKERYESSAALAHVNMLHSPTRLKPQRAVPTAKSGELAGSGTAAQQHTEPSLYSTINEKSRP